MQRHLLTGGAGSQYRAVPTCSRDAPRPHPHINVFNDVGAEAPQVPASPLPRSPNSLRDLASIGEKGTRHLRHRRPLPTSKCSSRPFLCRHVLSRDGTNTIRHAQSLFADILSVLAMTYSDTQPRGTLKYRLLSAELRPADSPLADPGSWGHEYVRHLAAELGEEYAIRELDQLTLEEVVPSTSAANGATEKTEEGSIPQLKLPGTIEDLKLLAKQCATFFLGHNAEPDAVDLLNELEIVDQLAELTDENTFGRVCQYMIRYVCSVLFRCVSPP